VHLPKAVLVGVTIFHLATIKAKRYQEQLFLSKFKEQLKRMLVLKKKKNSGRSW